MTSRITLIRYIQKCDEVIKKADIAEAKELQDEILAVFGSDIKGLKRGLTNYQVQTFVSTSDGYESNRTSADFLKDLRILRSRLQMEIEKEPEMNNNINIYGNATDVQIQQGSNNSNQMKGTEIEKYQDILNQINKYRSQIPDEFGEKSDALLEALDEAQEALDTRNVSGWQRAIGVIKDLAIGVSGSLIASGILGLLPAI